MLELLNLPLKDRLRSHYEHFREYLKGNRKENNRFKYLESIWPDIAKIELIKIVQNDYLYKIEIDYIAQYIKEGHNLVNQTYGGEGGDTFSLQDTINKEAFSELIRQKQTGKRKPVGFAENLSKLHTGSGNPMAGVSKLGWVVCFTKDLTPLKLFKYPFEITEFLDTTFPDKKHKKNSETTGNISKGIRTNKSHVSTSCGFIWKQFDMCDKEIQDIVEAEYESNRESSKDAH